MGQPPIRVLIVDDHTIVRKGLTALLGTRADIQVVGEARDGRFARYIRGNRRCTP